MKNKFIQLLKSTKIEGIDSLIKHLDDNSFFESPASTQHHLCHAGGLLEHSLNVYSVAITLPMARNMDDNDVIIACLLHDVGKMGAFGESNYVPNVLKSEKVSTAKPWKSNNLGLEHQDISLMTVNKFIDLNKNQAIAIKYHNGLYTSDGRSISGKETPLMMLVHFADMWASRVVEK